MSACACIIEDKAKVGFITKKWLLAEVDRQFPVYKPGIVFIPCTYPLYIKMKMGKNFNFDLKVCF